MRALSSSARAAMEPEINRMHALWRAGDGEGLYALTGAEMKAEYPALYERMNTARNLAWLPRVKAPQVFRFAQALAARQPDARRALLTMPPLLRTYLLMGGWISDHAVIDRQMDTLHVFTGVEIAAIPPARARALRALAG